MPRISRTAPEGHIYHVLARGNNRQAVFKKPDDYSYYLGILSRYKEKYGFLLYHYVLIGNHVHLIIEPSEKGGRLADIMKGINLSYALYFKREHRHTGHFWQDRFKSILISKDDYLLACASYVELNPVRAGIVEDPKEYPWSSYNYYAYGKRDAVTDEDPVYNEFSRSETERRKLYRQFVKGMLDKGAMKGSMDGRLVFGNEEFTSKVQSEYKIKEVIGARGRPRKSKK